MAASGQGAGGDEVLRGEAAAWLARLRGPSSAEDHAGFESWYNADPRHAAAYDAVLDSWESLGKLASKPAGEAPAALARTRHGRRYAIAAAVALVIVLLTFGAYGAGLLGRDVTRTVEFASRTGEIRSAQLADGSRVMLDTASLLQASYSVDERRVELLRGRARSRLPMATSGRSSSRPDRTWSSRTARCSTSR